MKELDEEQGTVTELCTEYRILQVNQILVSSQPHCRISTTLLVILTDNSAQQEEQLIEARLVSSAREEGTTSHRGFKSSLPFLDSQKTTQLMHFPFQPPTGTPLFCLDSLHDHTC